MLMLIITVLAVCVIMSTKADRAVARERLRPIGRALAPFTILLWLWILGSVIMGAFRD
jgi:hypothetical protein